ncbi:polysaccharide deacetylase family protein [Abditibacterium utsteinense]|uniref:polysaccharide deacetylase family protein n=1 Tax=Abditibacterium utsteinense TaxID=1960156 RepID=UPI000F492A84|nr:polysaccharide deacetylase family protein [Abditibacterium utsteinense]
MIIGTLFAARGANAAPLPGENLPNLELATAAGNTRRAWQPGHVTVISFCAFWCDTWKEQSRRLDSSRQALRGLPVDWTMISVDGRWSAKARDGAWSDVARNALLDTGSRWTHRLDVTSVPYTLVVDGAGKILFTAQGIARADQLRGAVRLGLSAAPTQSETVHLAFDDFPSKNSALDDALLDILRARGLKAIFYGSPARRASSAEIASRAAREGHVLKGAFNYSQANLVDPFDFKLVGENELLRRISGALKGGKTLVLRAGVRDTVQILPRLLSGIGARGIQIKP